MDLDSTEELSIWIIGYINIFADIRIRLEEPFPHSYPCPIIDYPNPHPNPSDAKKKKKASEFAWLEDSNTKI